jgi:hypothetical protein
VTGKEHSFVLFYLRKECEGRDLNPRTSARTDLESASVDQAWIPSREWYAG